MGKPHPQELRERVVAFTFVQEGHSQREAARHFRVSPRFVNNMMILYRRTGSLAAKCQEDAPGKAKLLGWQNLLEERLAENSEVTLDEVRLALARQGGNVHRATVGRFLGNMNDSNKKNTSRKRAEPGGNCPSASTLDPSVQAVL